MEESLFLTGEKALFARLKFNWWLLALLSSLYLFWMWNSMHFWIPAKFCLAWKGNCVSVPVFSRELVCSFQWPSVRTSPFTWNLIVWNTHKKGRNKHEYQGTIDKNPTGLYMFCEKVSSPLLCSLKIPCLVSNSLICKNSMFSFQRNKEESMLLILLPYKENQC